MRAKELDQEKYVLCVWWGGRLGGRGTIMKLQISLKWVKLIQSAERLSSLLSRANGMVFSLGVWIQFENGRT